MASEFHYPECTRGEYHTGELLNLVCLEPKCIQQSVICGICYDESHRSHKIKPLKLIINNSKKYLDALTPLHLDVGKIKESLRATKDSMITSYSQFEQFIHDSIVDIKTNVEALFIKIEQQIDLKAGSTDQLLSALEELKTKSIAYDSFVQLMQKLLAGVPLDPEEEDTEISGSELEQSVRSIQEQIEKDLKTREAKIKVEIEALKSSLQKVAEKTNLFEAKKDFRFSSELKHGGIALTSETMVKSTEGYSYRFALMEPSINERGNKPFKVGFKIKENSSNWLAVGVCYKNAVASSNYNFNYSALGHGAYLVSSNAGKHRSMQDHGRRSTRPRTTRWWPSATTWGIPLPSTTIPSRTR
jgi:hypothetical protein